MDSKYLLLAIIAAVGVERIFELLKSRRHVKALIAQGGKEHAPAHYRVMVLMHALWFCAMPLEVFLLDRPFIPWLFALALAAALLGQSFRYLAMNALGPRWTTRIITISNAGFVTKGIYHYFKHPIYLGVILEIAAFPLLHGAYLTAIAFTIFNALVLRTRIREEEKALRSTGLYDESFGSKPGFLPTLLCVDGFCGKKR